MNSHPADGTSLHTERFSTTPEYGIEERRPRRTDPAGPDAKSTSDRRHGLLPSMVGPLPDEIFGSWLKRLEIENGIRLWRDVWRRVGVQKPPSCFDMPYGVQNEQCLEALNTTQTEVLDKLSTHPFHRNFSAAAPAEDDGGYHNHVRMMLPRHTPYTDSNLRSQLARRTTRQLSPKYCPECVTSDQSRHGYAYWHRTHQLRVSIACHLHGCLLLDRCPACDQVAQITPTGTFDLPTGVCTCGEPVGKHVIEADLCFQRLAQFAHAALCNHSPSWSGSTAKKVAKRALRGQTASAKGTFSEFYGIGGDGRKSTSVRPRNSLIPFNVRILQTKASASEICAMAVAAGLDYATFSQLCSDDSDQKIGSLDEQLWTISTAREVARDHKKSHAARTLQKAHPAVYWTLYFHDIDWLIAEFPGVRRRPIPSIALDRATIKASMKSPKHLAWRMSSASARAAVRDVQWFNKASHAWRLARTKKRRKSQRPVWASSDDAARVMAALAKAIDGILADEHDTRPRSISRRRLINYAGLPAAVTHRALRANPAMVNRLNILAKDLRRRIADWGYRTLLKEGKRISIWNIIQRSKLDGREGTLEYCEILFAKHQSIISEKQLQQSEVG